MLAVQRLDTLFMIFDIWYFKFDIWYIYIHIYKVRQYCVGSTEAGMLQRLDSHSLCKCLQGFTWLCTKHSSRCLWGTTCWCPSFSALPFSFLPFSSQLITQVGHTSISITQYIFCPFASLCSSLETYLYEADVALIVTLSNSLWPTSVFYLFSYIALYVSPERESKRMWIFRRTMKIYLSGQAAHTTGFLHHLKP